eukprot:CAMPEP_0169166006 /NCGR_PEP_ID=MMETSP1015-20121227/59716_1 /TAXON_ID=342587 /ORGANISM="Karlodinium micrum, Strain CCMP2283" /LENGTH=318 /DNA_ID=CAMNT_0009238637 /DNA_START=51 /DNA_END=1007 /DNA_ORIENTATION=+
MFSQVEKQDDTQPWMACLANAAWENVCFGRGTSRNESMPRSSFEERNAMILGMNPKALRKSRMWSVHLWLLKKRHWAIVLQPADAPFHARIVDDFVYNARHCYNSELPSKYFFLVYEMLADSAGPYLMLSAKPDFDPEHSHVRFLGDVGPVCFDEVQTKALSIVRRYRHYSCIAANCQHFAMEFAVSLGVRKCEILTPDDESIVRLVGSIAFISVVAGYHVVHACVREDLVECRSHPKAIELLNSAGLECKHVPSEEEPASEPPVKRLSWLEDGTPLPLDLEHEEEATDEEPECELKIMTTCVYAVDSPRKRLFHFTR